MRGGKCKTRTCNGPGRPVGTRLSWPRAGLRRTRLPDHLSLSRHPPFPRHPGSTSMAPAAILTLLLIGGFVWGGLILILVTALRKERDKGGEA